MKRLLIRTLIHAGLILVFYRLLLWFMADKGIVSGVFSPGAHLPFYSLPLIFLFILTRIYFIFLPGFILSRLGLGLLKLRAAKVSSPENL